MNDQLNPQFLKLINRPKSKGLSNLQSQNKKMFSLNRNIEKQVQLNFGFSQQDWSKPSDQNLNFDEIQFFRNNKPTSNKNQIENNSNIVSDIVNQDENNKDQFKQFENFCLQQQNKTKSEQKRKRLQIIYNKTQKRTKNSTKVLTQLQQISKFNQQSLKIFDKNQQDHFNNSNKKLMQAQKVYLHEDTQFQKDFFSQYQQQNSRIQDAQNNIAQYKNDKSMVYNNDDIQKYQEYNNINDQTQEYTSFNHSNHSQGYKNQHNIGSTNQQNINEEEIQLDFQTQNLLKKPTQLTFSLKAIPISILITKFIFHTISITSISWMYGFISSIVLFILHDFTQLGFIIALFVINKHNNSHKIMQNPNQNQNTINSNNPSLITINVSDQIQTPNIDKKQQKVKSYLKYIKKVKLLQKIHQYFKLSTYISSVSLLGFIIFHVLHIDMFFYASLFEIGNWISVIVLSLLFLVGIILNFKLNKKSGQISFHYKNVIKDAEQFQMNKNAILNFNENSHTDIQHEVQWS